MEFGGYTTSYLKTGDANSGYGLHWYDIVDTNYWELPLSAANYGTESILTEKTMTAIIDTGTTLIAIPTNDFDVLKN